jgi:hypothetical protein
VADATLMSQLNAFCDMEVPCLLWKNHGAFSTLYIFMAVRFLSQPDSVLDCEGTHARWKWIETFKRAVSFRMLNALLKLQTFISQFGSLPPLEEMLPYVERVKIDLRLQIKALRDEGTVVLTDKWMYQGCCRSVG